MAKVTVKYLCLMSVLASFGCGSAGNITPTERVQNTNGPAWPVKEMITQALHGIPSNAELKILLWKIMESDKPLNRPLYSDSCIAYIKWNNGADKWRLAHLYRHPNSPNALRRNWSVFIILGVPHVGTRNYAHKPTYKDIHEFLVETWWRFKAENGCTLIDVGIDSASWQSCFDSTPPEHLCEQVKSVFESKYKRIPFPNQKDLDNFVGQKILLSGYFLNKTHKGLPRFYENKDRNKWISVSIGHMYRIYKVTNTDYLGKNISLYGEVNKLELPPDDGKPIFYQSGPTKALLIHKIKQ